MKKFAALLIAGGAMWVSGGGCADPAYSGAENIQRVAHSWRYDALEANDDWDNLLMLRPASKMSMWNAKVGDDQ